MNFSEALEEFKKGKAIRLPKWIKWYSHEDGPIKECNECDNVFTLDEILSEDWEIYEGKK